MRSKQTKQGLLEGRESKSILKQDKRTAMSTMAAGRGRGSGSCYHELIKQEVQACICRNICHGNQMYYSNGQENKSHGRPDKEQDVCSLQGAGYTEPEAEAGSCSWGSNQWGGFLKFRWENGGGWGMRIDSQN